MLILLVCACPVYHCVICVYAIWSSDHHFPINTYLLCCHCHRHNCPCIVNCHITYSYSCGKVSHKCPCIVNCHIIYSYSCGEVSHKCPCIVNCHIIYSYSCGEVLRCWWCHLVWEVCFHRSHPTHLFTCSSDGSLWHWDSSNTVPLNTATALMTTPARGLHCTSTATTSSSSSRSSSRSSSSSSSSSSGSRSSSRSSSSDLCSWQLFSYFSVFLAHDAFIEPNRHAMMFVRLSGTGVHCDHTMHVSADLSLRLDSPVFWAPWHQSMSTYFQPSFSSSTWNRWGMDVQTRPRHKH